MPMKDVLHVGCGSASPVKLNATFRGGGWREIRLDIDPNVKPDIVASIIDMSMIKDETVDAVWSSHNLEHLFPHEVPLALGEFFRILKKDGFALITLPDLQQVAKLVADDKLDEPAYMSPAGPIAPLDMIFGLRKSLAQGNAFMGHKTGFTAKTLRIALEKAGFSKAQLQQGTNFDLWAAAYKDPNAEPPNLIPANG
jgi:predicted SAM-dependent methyltransferase